MQLKNFKIFLSDIFKEANRLQKRNIAGQVLTTRKYTDTQKISIILAILGVAILKHGFSDSFAGYTISFLGIFIGLFTTIIISMYEKKDAIIENYLKTDQVDKNRIIKIRNYLLQFTALVSYSIIVALFVIVLLFIVLLSKKTQINIWDFNFINPFKEFKWTYAFLLLQQLLICLHRFFVIYFLCMFFANTIFSVSSYFSFLISEYKRIRLKDNHIV